MKIIYIKKFHELKLNLGKISDPEKCNFISYVCGEFGYVSVNILLMIKEFILHSFKNNFKCYCFCLEGHEVLYDGMDIDTLFVLCMDNEKYEQLKKKV